MSQITCFLPWICFDNYNVGFQQKNNIPVQLYLSNNGKYAFVCLSSQNGKLRKNLTLGLEGITYREYRYVWQCRGLAQQVHTEGFVVGCCWASATLSWKKGFFGLFWTTLYSRLVPCKVLKCRCWNVGNSEGKYCNCFKPQKYFTKQKTTLH